MRSVSVRLYVTSVVLTLITAFVVIVIAYVSDTLALPLIDDALFRLVIGSYESEMCKPCEARANERGYLIGVDETITHVWGTLPCAMGDKAETCLLEGAWREKRQPLSDGQIAVVQINERLPLRFYINDFFSVMWQYFRWVIIVAIPLSLLLSLLVVAPLLRRLRRIAATSRAVASGDLEARTNETRLDEIGQLGRQFDHMATTISRQVKELRDLAKSNSMLALAAERNARAAERLALSRDLHDSISQHLFSLAMGTNDLAALIRRDPNKAAVQAEQLSQMAAQAQDDLRGVLSQLRSETRTGRGLLESLTDFVELWRERYELPVTLQLEFKDSLPIVVENVFYRVVQEALNNIARHAEARHVDVTLTHQETAVCLQISDDGKGFDVRADNAGFGLLGMRERVRAIGGRLELSSSREGTTLKALVPVESLVVA
jgi:two-component system, NarL family, sensor histidine kinase LiaS